MKSPGALRIGAPAVAALIVVEAAISIGAGWPHVGGHPHQVLPEFLGSGGTALAPPLWLLVLLVLIAAGVQRPGRWRTTATALLIPVAALLAFGAAREAAAAPTADVPRAAALIGGTVGTLLSLGLLALAVAALFVARRQPAPTAVPTVAPAALGGAPLHERL